MCVCIWERKRESVIYRTGNTWANESSFSFRPKVKSEVKINANMLLIKWTAKWNSILLRQFVFIQMFVFKFIPYQTWNHSHHFVLCCSTISVPSIMTNLKTSALIKLIVSWIAVELESFTNELWVRKLGFFLSPSFPCAFQTVLLFKVLFSQPIVLSKKTKKTNMFTKVFTLR